MYSYHRLHILFTWRPALPSHCIIKHLLTWVHPDTAVWFLMGRSSIRTYTIRAASRTNTGRRQSHSPGRLLMRLTDRYCGRHALCTKQLRLMWCWPVTGLWHQIAGIKISCHNWTSCILLGCQDCRGCQQLPLQCVEVEAEIAHGYHTSWRTIPSCLPANHGTTATHRRHGR